MSDEIILPVLRLPSSLRRELAIPQGRLVVSRKTIKDLEVDVTVGDIVSKTLKAPLKIIDYKTRRSVREGFKGEGVASVINPRGTLSLNSRTITKIHDRGVISVLGEEDLLTLAYALERDGSRIAYGQPGLGVVILVSDRYRALKVLKTFKPDILSINRVE
jgi:uncharacterized protein (UPF0218 family)